MTADLLSVKIAIVSEVAAERELVRQAAAQVPFPMDVSEVEVTNDALAMGTSLARESFDVVFFDSRIPKPDRQTVLVLQTLLWSDEVREAAFPSLDEPVRISAKELELSASLVESFAADFDPSEFADEYQDELRTLIQAKIEQGDALDTSETFGDHEEEETGGEVIDLMAALRASVERSRAAREGKGETKTDAAPKGAAKASSTTSAKSGKAPATKAASAKPASTAKPAAKKKAAKAS